MAFSRRAAVALAVPALALAARSAIRANALRKLRSKTVLITGGSRGLGLEIARQCLQHGARVAFCGRTSRQVSEAARELQDQFGEQQVLGMQCDITQEDDVSAFVRDALRSFSQIDVLINNAGFIQVGPRELMKREDYEEALATHFWGPYLMVQAALPALIKSQGRVVNIASIGGKVSVPHLLPYSTSKFALVGFSEGLSIELARHGVSVTTVCPGLMRTGSAVNAWFKGQYRKEYTWFSIGSSLPLLTCTAESAARQILVAAMQRKSSLTFPLSTRLATLAHQVAPAASMCVLRAINKLLPRPGGIGVSRAKGYRSQTRWSPSMLTILGDRAAQRNNELP